MRLGGLESLMTLPTGDPRGLGLSPGQTETGDQQSTSANDSDILHGEVVAVVLTWRGRIGLFKRSHAVHSDRGLWHCISGYVDPGCSPVSQAIKEVYQETGLGVSELKQVRIGPALPLPDPRGGSWIVHTFRADTERRRLDLNWEHDDYRWVKPQNVRRFAGRVEWLDQVVSLEI